MTYTSGDFDIQRTRDYTLLVRIAGTDAALAVIDTKSELLFLKVFDLEASEEGVMDLLRAPFKKVKIATLHHSIFVPIDVFDKNQLQTYARHLPADGIMSINVSEVQQLGIKVLYQADALEVEMHSDEASRTIFPITQPFLHGIANFALAVAEPVIAIDLRAQSVSICILKQNDLLYCKDFEIYSSNDLNYYLIQILAAFESIPKENFRCCISGEVNKSDERFDLLSNLFDNVTFADSGKLTNILMPVTLDLDSHRLLTLLGLNLCE